MHRRVKKTLANVLQFADEVLALLAKQAVGENRGDRDTQSQRGGVERHANSSSEAKRVRLKRCLHTKGLNHPGNRAEQSDEGGERSQGRKERQSAFEITHDSAAAEFKCRLTGFAWLHLAFQGAGKQGPSGRGSKGPNCLLKVRGIAASGGVPCCGSQGERLFENSRREHRAAP